MRHWLDDIKLEAYDESRTIIWDDDAQRMIIAIKELVELVDSLNSCCESESYYLKDNLVYQRASDSTKELLKCLV